MISKAISLSGEPSLHSRLDALKERAQDSERRVFQPPFLFQSLGTGWEELARETNFEPQVMAQRLGISLRTMQRHFSRYNLKVGRWLCELRLKEAYERLAEGEMVKRVAYDLNYTQVSNFSRDFKKAFGISPSALNPDTARKTARFELSGSNWY